MILQKLNQKKMKAKNKMTGAIIEFTEYGFTLLPKSEWERYEEPTLEPEQEQELDEPGQEPEVEQEITLEPDKLIDYDTTPQAEPEKPSKAKTKSKSKK